MLFQLHGFSQAPSSVNKPKDIHPLGHLGGRQNKYDFFYDLTSTAPCKAYTQLMFGGFLSA